MIPGSINPAASWLAETIRPLARKTAWHLPLLLGAAIIIISTLVRIWETVDRLPYPLHVDEKLTTAIPLQILKTEDWNPHVFSYPSLPFYLNTAGLALGFLLDVKNVGTVNDVSTSYYPFYSHPRAMLPLKLLTVGSGTLIMILVLSLGRQAYQHRLFLWLIPLLLSLCPLAIRLSWQYSNVDIFASFFAVLSLLVLMKGLAQPRGIGPGYAILLAMACAASTTSKYHHGLILLPVFAAALLYRDRFRSGSLLAFIAAFPAFIILFMPYLVLDVREFLDNVIRQVRNYQLGHRNFEGEPGLSQMRFHLGRLSVDYGIASCIFALLGLVAGFRYAPKQTLILLAAPLALFLYMSMQRTNFTRNLLLVYSMMPVWTVLGILTFMDWSQYWTNRLMRPTRPWILAASWARHVALGAAIASIVLTLNWERVKRSYHVADSRIEFRDWAKRNLPESAVLFVHQNMHFDARTLQPGLNAISYKDSKDLRRSLRSVKTTDAFALVPEFHVKTFSRTSVKKRQLAIRADLINEDLGDLLNNRQVKQFGKSPFDLLHSQRHAVFNPKFTLVDLSARR